MGRFISKLFIRIVLFFIDISMLILTIGCNETEIKSKSLIQGSKEITVDGNLNEWDKNIFISLDDKLKIAAYDDDKFYYLSGEILDKSIGRTFALSGITLLINPEGDKKNNIEVNFKYPGRKQIDYEKGGFFRVLSGDQKIRVLRNLEKINDAVFVFDTTELKSFAFTESEDADFQGKMKIADNKLLFELKIPFQFNKYFESYNVLNEKSLFCLTHGSRRAPAFGFPMQTGNNPEEKKENIKGRQRESDLNSPQSLQYWFSIKTECNE
jgi:hypothetical protein